MAIVPTAMNGNFPSAFLATMPGKNGDGSPHLLDQIAERSYRRLARDFPDDLGPLTPTDGWSVYRTRADQQHMRNIGLTTIPVGKSIHGEAGGVAAVDFSGVGFGTKRHNWLKANAGRYGWSQPAWAQKGGSLPEPWHWEYNYKQDTQPGPPPPPPIPPVTTSEEDDVFVISQRESGIALVGSNFFHLFTGDEWYTYSEQVVNKGVIKATILPDGPVGAEQFRIIRSIHTSPQ